MKCTVHYLNISRQPDSQDFPIDRPRQLVEKRTNTVSRSCVGK